MADKIRPKRLDGAERSNALAGLAIVLLARVIAGMVQSAMGGAA